MQTPFFKLSIPQPCTQSWEGMTPSDNGRHCGACDKVVTDFSGMSDQQVQDFFVLHHGQPICGRFRKVQLDRIRIQIPSYILRKSIPHWKKFLALLLICFGSTIFSFDVAFGNTFNSNTIAEYGAYRQEEIKKKAPVKKKKRKKRFSIKKDLVLAIPEWGDMVYGFTTSKPEEPVYQPKMTDPLVYGIDSAGLLFSSMPLDKKAPPEKKNPFSKTEFIIPAAFARRKRKK